MISHLYGSNSSMGRFFLEQQSSQQLIITLLWAIEIEIENIGTQILKSTGFPKN